MAILQLFRYLVTPAERGFYCNETSITQPLLPNTISTLTLLAITLGLPLPIVFLAGLLRSGNHRRQNLINVVSRTTWLYFNYCLSFWIMSLVLDVIKCTVGRPRPNFLALCVPHQLNEVCGLNPDQFVAIANCTSGWKKSRNSKMSFPSGHSAASLRSSFFSLKFMYYLIVSMFYLVFTVYCCYSRVKDFWHFKSDVFGGILLGSFLFYVLIHKRYTYFQ